MLLLALGMTRYLQKAMSVKETYGVGIWCCSWCDYEAKMAVDAIARMGGDGSSIAIELGLCNADGARGVIHMIVSYLPVVYAAFYSL
jgi:hypothetical protein